MPILANAKKALRASKRKSQVNQKVRSRVKSSLKKVAVEAKPENIQQAQSAIDKAVKKNIFHKNKAARIKSKIAKQAKQDKPTKQVKKVKQTKQAKKSKGKTKK